MINIKEQLDNTVLYWQKSLINADRIDVSRNEFCEKLENNSALDGISGQISKKFFKEYKKQLSKNKGENNNKLSDAADEISSVPVLYAPIVARSVSKNSGERLLIPIWLECSMDLNGQIAITPDTIPILNTDCIEPHVRTAFSFGATRAEIDQAISKVGTIPSGTTLENINDYFDKLFVGELDINLNEIEFQEPFQLTEHQYIALDLEERGLSQPLIDVYAEINEAKSKPKLINRVFSTPNTTLVSSSDKTKHTGHISGEYPLNEGQRLALYGNMNLNDGEILAVTGPPGTGKTTLIGNIIASEWVNAAIDESDAPIIFIASTNNQAVQNAVDSFSDTDKLPKDHPYQENPALLKRWIEDVHSFGSLFPSSEAAKKDEIRRFQLISRQRGKVKWSGWICDVEDLESLEDKKDHYVECARKSFPDTSFDNISDVIKFLHKQLVNSKAHLLSALDLQQRVINFQDKYDTDDVENFLSKNISNREENIEKLNQSISELDEKISKREGNLQKYSKIANEALKRFDPQGFVEIIGSIFSKSIRQRRSTRAIKFLSDKKISSPDWTYETVLSEGEIRKHLSVKESDFKKRLEEAKAKKQGIITERQILQAELDKWIKEKSDYEALINEWSLLIKNTYQHSEKEIDSRTGELIRQPDLFDKELDIYYRLFLFILASHYWEGRWLLELEKIDNEAPTSLYGSVQNDIEGFFKRLTMLTPCLGSTLHMMPKLLNAFVPKTGSNVSLFDFVDLLIMDEAGQVAPEIGMTGISFAKKALVIGDTDQIEPVRAFGEHEDIKLIKEYSLIDVYEDMKERGLTISSGNMMQIAKVQSAYSINEDTQGMFLSDHWRCVPEIINYCNKLVYKGQLSPQKPSSKITEFPAMGFAHIPSQSMKRGGSRYNPLEAKSIADWIAHNSEKLRSTFGKGKTLEDVIGVVTPFAAQAGEITKALKAAGIKNRIQVGTVHRFQGGEKDIMIFSSVYGKDDDVRSYFFDSGKNMMNVAVSRAKESFLVFGDMRIFANQPRNTPSGLLGSYLLSNPEQNEITDVIVPTRVGRAIEIQCQRVRTLEDHRKALHETLTQSQERIIIMSAFLSINAIEQDDIIKLLKDAGERGVKRLVLYDVAFNKDKKRAEKTLAAFEESGVPIHGVNGIHHKTLAYDNEFYMDGSFNWLSAQRDSTHKFHNQEGSLLVRGAEARDWIDQTWEEAIALVKGKNKYDAM